jgi:hypothetical protein
MHKEGKTQSIRYAASHAINKTDSSAKILLIYIHGVNRNGLEYFESAENMVRSVQEKKETLIIAPNMRMIQM